MSEHSLILRLKNGDNEALAEVYSKFRMGFVGWITSVHQCSKEEAVEIYQYAILTFYENVAEGLFEEFGSAGIKTYLFSIGKNKLLADSRKRMKISYEEDLKEESIEAEDYTDEDFVKQEKLEKVLEAMNQLGNPCKRIMQLFYFNNLEMDEIAEIMGYKNANTVKNAKYKCLQRLKHFLNSD